MKKHYHLEVLPGVMASFNGKPSKKLIHAVQQLAEAAKKITSPGKLTKVKIDGTH